MAEGAALSPERGVAFLHAEGMLNPVELRLFCRPQQDFHHVEAKGNGFPQQFQPVARAQAQKFAFFPIDRPPGRARRGGCGALHLAEEKRIPLTSDEVDLSPSTPAEILPQDTDSSGAQKRRGCLFAVEADGAAIRQSVSCPGAIPSVQQVQTSGDGGG